MALIPKYEVEPCTAEVERRVYDPEKRDFTNVKETVDGFMAYMPSGNSLFIRNKKRLAALGLTEGMSQTLVDDETGEESVAPQAMSLKDRALAKSHAHTATHMRKGA